MRALEFLTGYVTFKLHYDQIYQLKTTSVCQDTKKLSWIFKKILGHHNWVKFINRNVISIMILPNCVWAFEVWMALNSNSTKIPLSLELVSKELNHLAAILHVYAGGLNFMK